MAGRPLNFGIELRRLRLAAGLSLTDLSARIHYSKGYLSKLETGHRPASRAVAEHCEAVLNATGALVGLVPSDDRSARGREPHAVATPVPAQLPHDVLGFAGREAELAELDHAAAAAGDSGMICAIDGAAGIGKTALAIRFGHRVAQCFPDGQIYLNLRGFDPHLQPMNAKAALEHLLRAVGTDLERGVWSQLVDLNDQDNQAALYRSVFAGKRILLVLDNAVSADQVVPLLPGSAGCLVVITSRERLGGLVVRYGARRITLRPLAQQAAVTLVTRVVGTARAAAEPEAVHQLVRLCDSFPLALCVAAERVAARSNQALAELTEQLVNERDRLDTLAINGDAISSVRTVLSWSYRALPPEPRHMFRLLGLLPYPDISVSAAAVLADVTMPEARRLLDTLANLHLLEETMRDEYQAHDLLHAYAAELVSAEDPPVEHRTALRRVLSWYLRCIDAHGDQMRDVGWLHRHDG